MIQDGVVDDAELKKQSLTHEDLVSVLNKNGYSDPSDVQTCVLEPNGTFFVEGKKPSSDDAERAEVVKMLKELTIGGEGVAARGGGARLAAGWVVGGWGGWWGRRGREVFGAGSEEPWGRGGELRVFDGGAVASHEDGVHDGEGAADSEDKAEEDTDEHAGEEVHDDAMVCPVLHRVG